MHQLLSRTIGLTAIATVQTAFWAVNPPVANANQFNSCVRKLTNSEITSEAAAIACGVALKPNRLSHCVTRIYNLSVPPADALDYCFRVRRPRDFAICFANIYRSGQGADANMVLDSCRRSLLPKRFAKCVRGVTPRTELASETILNACLADQDLPAQTVSQSPDNNNTEPEN